MRGHSVSLGPTQPPVAKVETLTAMERIRSYWSFPNKRQGARCSITKHAMFPKSYCNDMRCTHCRYWSKGWPRCAKPVNCRLINFLKFSNMDRPTGRAGGGVVLFAARASHLCFAEIFPGLLAYVSEHLTRQKNSPVHAASKASDVSERYNFVTYF